MTDIILLGLIFVLALVCIMLNRLRAAHDRTSEKLSEFSSSLEQLDDVSEKFSAYSKRVELYQDTLSDIHITLTDIRFELDALSIRNQLKLDDQT